MPRKAVPFFDRVEKTPTCWIWTGGLTAEGYGSRWYDGKVQSAHRVAYQMLVGPIPDGMTLDHLCHNSDKTCRGGTTCPHRRCVNPDHLEPASRRENQHRGVNGPGKLRVEACPQGHAYTPENTYIPPSRPNARHCWTCIRARNHRGGSQYRQAARARAREEAAQRGQCG